MIKGKTFEEKWKVAALALVAGAGIVATVLLTALVFIVWKGSWTEAVEAARLNMLATSAIGMTVLMGMSMVGLLIAGPLARLSGKWGDSELTVEGDD